MNKKYVIVFAIAVLVTAILISTQIQLGALGKFPEKLEGLTLSGVQEGNEALESITLLYGFSSRLGMTDAFVIDYDDINGESVSIWISRSEDHEKAFHQGQYLTRSIGPMNGFTIPEKVELDEIKIPTVNYVEGLGLQHYYYVKKNSVYWISTNIIMEGKRMEIVEQVIRKID